ncbi:MAG: NAD(P)-dependent oxidoreductase [Rhodospirillaceae bacterium]|nr:NAD(P)-dependent oxidoreductase [Rhodospirillaceae bacterium]
MTSLNGTTVGFIGLGLMGKPMARNLHKAGAKMVIYNRTITVAEELALEGMNVATSPLEVTDRADIVILMLADTPAVEAVLLGEFGVIEGVGKNTLVIDMGTTLASEAKRFADAVAQKGGQMVDAPVSGGEIGALDASLTIMAGGNDDAIKRAQPLFDVMGAKTTHVGPAGAGQVAKAANQVIVGLSIGAVSEALALAKHMGVDPARVREALKGGFADSRILEVHGQRMIDGTFKPGGKCTTQRKDMDQALKLAAGIGLDLPATKLSRDLYDKAIEKGLGDLDHSGLFKLIDGQV